ncbi:MAG: GyrI-like domain-containing protein [Tissierellales bacterium]|jgi:predicted transcriptional regulator YdeE|nr:GyrI-like domain-containing protein [Tissierellales bacterium]
MKYQIVEIEKMIVMGISTMTTNENCKSKEDIGLLWKKFIESGLAHRIENKKTGEAIGLYTDYESDATKPYRFMCCMEVTELLSNGLESQVIRAGKFAKFTVKGDVVNAVAEAWQNIWDMNLERTYISDFEVYHSEDMENQEIDIYIGIK